MHNPHERLRRGLGGTNFGSPDGVAGAEPLQRAYDCKHPQFITARLAPSLTRHCEGC